MPPEPPSFFGPLRIVGDVHGDSRAFAAALATDRYVIQLGDLVDNGPDSAGALTMALDMVDQRRGLFLLGNHDWKLAQALAGRAEHIGRKLRHTMSQLSPELAARALAAIPLAPAWARRGKLIFVHGGFHTAMLEHAPPSPVQSVDGAVSRALYGQPTGRTQTDGYPERSLDWIDRIPAGFTLYCGHDPRSTDGRPLTMTGRQGGQAIFVDTGAGKGGHLSWIDID